MDSNDTQLDRRDFIRTLAVVGIAAGALTLEPAPAEAASCPKVPKPKTSKEIVPSRIESELGDVIDGQMDLRTVVRIPDTTRPNQISFELMFDTFEEGRSVRELTDKVATLALVHQELHRPPTALLTWGTGLAFKCILESSKVGFTLFLDDGTPVRAVMATRFQVLLDDCTLGTP